MKRAQVSSTLVMMIAGLVALLVLLSVTGVFGQIFRTVTDKNECQIEFLVSSFTKTAGAQAIEPSCEPHRITITDANLTRQEGRVKKIVDEYVERIEKTEHRTKDSYVNYKAEFWNDNKQKQNEWAMNEIIAKEMKYCWDVTGQGKLDLFSDWWNLLKCEKEGKFEPCKKEDLIGSSKSWMIFRSAAGYLVAGVPGALAGSALPTAWGVITGDITTAEPPTFCVLCARIKFDNTIIQTHGSQTITSLPSWLANNPVATTGPGSKIPYAAYIQNENFQGLFTEKAYSYTPDEPYAVLYARVNVFQTKDMLDKVTEIIYKDEQEVPEAIQIIKLVPYADLQNQCAFLVG